MRIRIRNLLDPGSGIGMEKLVSGIRNKHSGSATLVLLNISCDQNNMDCHLSIL
jgi:hypothetical protein